MNMVLEQIAQSTVITALEVYCAILFYEIFAEWRRKRLQRVSALILLVLLVMLTAAVLSDTAWIKECLIICLYALIMWYCMKVSFIKSFVLAGVYIGILMLADSVVLLLRAYIFPESSLDNVITIFLLSLLSKSMAMLTVFILRICLQKQKWSLLGNQEWLEFLLVPIYTVIMLVWMLAQDLELTDTRMRQVCLVASLGLIAMNIVMFHLMNRMAARASAQYQSEMLAKEMEDRLKRYETLAEHNDRQRKLAHDFRHHMNVLQSLCKSKSYSELDAYMEQVNEQVLSQVDFIDVGHSIMNAVLNEKYQKARREKIAFTVSVSNMANVCLPDQELVVLLSNLLDNAIEANAKCEKDRWMTLIMNQTEEGLALETRNSYNGIYQIEDGSYQTTKEENRSEHGHGLAIIRQIAEDHSGTILIKAQEEEFIVSVYIPSEEER